MKPVMESTIKHRLREMGSDTFASLQHPSYWYGIRHFIRLHQLRYPYAFNAVYVNAFLSWFVSLFKQSYRP